MRHARCTAELRTPGVGEMLGQDKMHVEQRGVKSPNREYLEILRLALPGLYFYLKNVLLANRVF